MGAGIHAGVIASVNLQRIALALTLGRGTGTRSRASMRSTR